MNDGLGGNEHLALVKKYNRQIAWVMGLALVVLIGALAWIRWGGALSPTPTDGELAMCFALIFGPISVIMTALLGLIGANGLFWSLRKLKKLEEERSSEAKHPR